MPGRISCQNIMQRYLVNRLPGLSAGSKYDSKSLFYCHYINSHETRRIHYGKLHGRGRWPSSRAADKSITPAVYKIIKYRPSTKFIHTKIPPTSSSDKWIFSSRLCVSTYRRYMPFVPCRHFGDPRFGSTTVISPGTAPQCSRCVQRIDCFILLFIAICAVAF